LLAESRDGLNSSWHADLRAECGIRQVPNATNVRIVPG